MFKTKASVKIDKKDRPTSSPFADFFRKASSQDKKEVFIGVAKKASAEQRLYSN